MLFCSAVFIFLFLPVTVLMYFRLVRYNLSAGRLFLLLASFFFYGYFNPMYLYLLVFSIGFNFLVGRVLYRHPRKLLLIPGILVNLFFLGYYKYYDFFIGNVNAVFATDIPLKHLLLPLGISFFTFQQIVYLYDNYKRNLTREYSFLIYALYVAFFPQLIAGPIVLPEEMIPQFENPENARFNQRNFSAGLFVFILGLAKKLLLADVFAMTVSKMFGMEAPCFLNTWTGSLCYVFQMYFDFSGYCDMAIGLGLMFNIELPVNFASPLKAASIQEFWRTWHITLGRFLATFVYRPLGGSKGSTFRTCFNLMVTFVLCGFWHGASWIFVLYGVTQGVAMVVHYVWHKKLQLVMPRYLGVLLTFFYFNVTLTFFQSRDFAEAGKLMKGLFGGNGFAGGFEHSGNVLGMILLGFGICFCLPRAVSFAKTFKPNAVTLTVSLVLFIMSVFCMNRISPFLYFNF